MGVSTQSTMTTLSTRMKVLLKKKMNAQKEMELMVPIALLATLPETVADSSKHPSLLRSRTSDKPQLRNREEEDRLDRLEPLWEFSVTPQLPMGITTSTFPTRMAPQDRNQELLMESAEATVLLPPRVRT